MKPKSIKTLKKELWETFALYMKKRYSEDGLHVKCYTCDVEMEIGTKNCQLGHWLPKKPFPYHYWNENNVRPQCFRCNQWMEGNSETFRRRLQAEIGVKKVDEMYASRMHKSPTRNESWYKAMIDKYKP